MALELDDGGRVGVIGGGPAGSLSAYFLLTFANRMDMPLHVDVYEPRDFTKPGPAGCNMCGGIVSESLIQALTLEGIELPPTIVQRGVDGYVLHTEQDSVSIDTPLHEKRIAAVHRGGGPRDVKEVKWGGLDGHLLGLAKSLGANVVPTRVSEVGWEDGRPQVRVKDDAQTYDLLVGAVGVNSAGWQLFESLGLKSQKPKTTKTYITEIKLGNETINEYFGSRMHMFLLDLPRLDFAAIIPKGDYVTVCMLGKEIDGSLVETFFKSAAVRRCFPPTLDPTEGICHCGPKINVGEAEQPFMDRLVLVGDCGATRLYKDGIGAAYRTAKAAARTAIFSGLAVADFQKHYLPTYRAIARDNRFGFLVFEVEHWIKRLKPVLRGVIGMTASEQTKAGSARRMSLVLWDMFTGSAPYEDVFYRTLDPRFLSQLLWQSALSAINGGHR